MQPPDDFASFEEVEISEEISRKVSEEVSQRVFDTQFRDLQERLNKQESLSFNIIIGAVIATFLLMVSLCFSTWLFMFSYNEYTNNAMSEFSGKIDDLRKENFEFKESILNDVK
jgi:hypothetical protein